jgi:multidrug efflux system membrane fusion protein
VPQLGSRAAEAGRITGFVVDVAPMTRSARRIVAFASVLLAAGFGLWHWQPWFGSQSDQQPQGRSALRRNGGSPNAAVPVLASTARRTDVPVYFEGVGTAQAFNTVLVRSQVDGKIMKIAFVEGNEVAQGSLIAKIDPTTYQAQYDGAVAKKAQDEAQLADARLDLERYTRLLATKAVQSQQVDTQKALVDQLLAQTQADQAAIENAKAILDYTDVVAPIAGITGIRMVDQGNIVHATDATGIVNITQIKPIAVLFNLPQQELPDLNKAMARGPLTLQAMGDDGTTVVDDGHVMIINNQVDQTTGTVQLKAEFPNAKVQLWPGQFINVRVLIDTLHQVVVIPTAAVQQGPDSKFVYVIQDDNAVALHTVKVLQQTDREAVIASGVLAQDRVVTSGFGRLTDGSHVEATSTEAEAQAPANSVGPSPQRNGNGPKGKGQRQPGTGG